MSEFWYDPALPFVESRKASDSRACYRPHSHPTLSIGAVDAGLSHFRCSDVAATLRPGSLVIVPPELVHSWVAGVTAEMEPTPGLPSSACINHSAAAYQHFCKLNAQLFSAISAADKEAALIEFIGQHLWATCPPVACLPAPRTLMEQLKARLLDNLDAPPSLVELAREYALSRYQLIRLFRRDTGLTPHAWLLDQRIQQAREQLRQGADLATLAQDLGFADQGHFQRMFKAHVAATPGRYRHT
tara:strand:+ start:61285 stop:62016 length:732 start_codon:yes stop_codon:yes gene_type:complete